jgi:hypothetical protein
MFRPSILRQELLLSRLQRQIWKSEAGLQLLYEVAPRLSECEWDACAYLSVITVKTVTFNHHHHVVPPVKEHHKHGAASFIESSRHKTKIDRGRIETHECGWVVRVFV